MSSVSEQIVSLQNTSTMTQAATAAASETSTSSSTVDSQAFLNLMCMQLQYQDPTNPTDNSEMLAQEAQFSTLEQMESLTSSFTSFANTYQANSLMGQNIEITTSSGDTVTGKVQYINMNDSEGASVCVNGTLYPVSQVSKVYPQESDTSSTSEQTSSIAENVSKISENISNLASKIGQYLLN